MLQFRMTAVIVALALGFGAPAGAKVRDNGPRFLSLGRIADAPAGFTEMCMRDNSFCGGSASVAPVFPSGADMPEWSSLLSLATYVLPTPAMPQALEDVDTQSAFKQIGRVNRWVNRNVFQVSDTISSGVDELWQRPDFSRMPTGDCEDIALEKFARLVEEGFPTDRMFFAIAYKRQLGLHAVLIVRLDDGDYVLDSLNAKVKPWNMVDYRWLRVQSPVDRTQWRSVGPPATTIAMANAVSDGVGI